MAQLRKVEAPLAAPAELGADLVVLPRETADDGRGLYDDSVITIVKELKSLGVEARYQHEKDQRAWIGEESAATLALALIVGIASSAGWSALQALCRGSFSTKRVRVRAGRYQQFADGTTKVEWYEVEGRGEDVADALAQLAPGEGPDEEANKTEIDG